MSSRSLIVFLFVNLCFNCFGNDTPFLVYDCYYGGTDDGAPTRVVFQDDDSHEVRGWSTAWNRSRIQIEKQDHQLAIVKLELSFMEKGALTPEEYTFTAPLITDRFEFRQTIHDPLKLTSTSLLLKCLKVVE